LLRRYVARGSDGVAESRKREIKVGGIGTRVGPLGSGSRRSRVGLGRVRLVPGCLERLIALRLVSVTRLLWACSRTVDLGTAVALRWIWSSSGRIIIRRSLGRLLNQR
jgi:hypothetical protein